MADQKISELTTLTGAGAATGDLIPVVDVSATTTKKMTRAQFFTNTPSIGIGTSSPLRTLDVQSASGDADVRIYAQGTTSADDSVLYLGLAGTTATSRINFGDADDADSGRIIYSHSGDDMSFFTAASEAMRIDSAGNVGIGTTSVNYRLAVKDSGVDIALINQNDTVWTVGQNVRVDEFSIRDASVGATRLHIDSSGNVLVGKTAASTTGAGIYMNPIGYMPITRAGTSGATFIQIVNDNGAIGGITGSGSTTSFVTSSDYRLKEDVKPMVGASDRLMALKPCNFVWKVDGSRVDGFLAHEAQAVVPESVTGEKDGEEMQAIDQSKLVPLLTAALQEALTEIADLKVRITALEV